MAVFFVFGQQSNIAFTNRKVYSLHKVLLRSFRIELELMNKLIEALDNDGDSFLYLQTNFPKLSDAKLKEGIFIGHIWWTLGNQLFAQYSSDNNQFICFPRKLSAVSDEKAIRLY